MAPDLNGEDGPDPSHAHAQMHDNPRYLATFSALNLLGGPLINEEETP